MSNATGKHVVFIENAIPPLRDGTYTLNVLHQVPEQNPGSASATSTFVVQGERFTLNPEEIAAVFPPNLANGEFDDVLPHVMLSRTTLPWERSPQTPGPSDHYEDAPWLAVLVCDQPGAPAPIPVTAKDLLPLGTHITVAGSTVTGTGTLPSGILSYGAKLMADLGYGETPDDACSVVDLPVTLFNQVAPAADDLAYLAHVREVDTDEAKDTDTATVRRAVVVAGRIAPSNGGARAYLVSLEGMSDYLPQPDGTPSKKISNTVTTVRLLVYHSWTFTTNDMDQTLENLLTGLNAPAADGSRATTLALPVAGNPPTAGQLGQALSEQASGNISPESATVLMRNALLMGYVPLTHHLRHGGNTVSFYRGPLAPLETAIPQGAAQYSGPDAANAYNPETGLFDVSLGAAWQLGQLLALQSAGMASQLYRWKSRVKRWHAAATEKVNLQMRLGGHQLFQTFFESCRAVHGELPPDLPDEVAAWFGNLAALQGVPFNYMVPDERMLPPESIRFFVLDANWMNALIDGAFSIGRATAAAESFETRHTPMMRRRARLAMGLRARNRKAVVMALGNPSNDLEPVSGFLMRSQAVTGWPDLRFLGFKDAHATQPLVPLRIAALSKDTVLCLFRGVLGSVLVREPPEALHLGVQGTTGAYFTTLRSVLGGPGDVQPGEQYTTNPVTKVTPCDPKGTHAWACIAMRPDNRVINVKNTADILHDRLSDFGQSLPNGVTAAEFALEMTKGVVEVEYRR